MSDRARQGWTAALAAALLAAGADASPQARFREAQARFVQAQQMLADPEADRVAVRRAFHEAAIRFADLARDGVASANLYVNAGNAYHFAGDHARALLWYLRAKALADTEETRSGLATLRRVCQVQPWPRPEPSIAKLLMFWHYDLNRRAKQIILLACYPAGCMLAAAGLLVKRRRGLWLRLGIALIVVGAAIGISDVVSTCRPGPPWAVVLEETTGYGGDGEGYSVVVKSIRPGQEVKILESREAWVRIELPAGTRCWIRAERCERV